MHLPFWLGLLLVLWTATAPANELKLHDLQCVIDGDFVSVQAQIDYALPDEVSEALRNGVMLGFLLELQLRRAEVGWWQPNRLELQTIYRIHYHSLASIFQVTHQSRDNPTTFATLDAALERLGQIENIPVVHLSALPAGRYEVVLSAHLDRDSLPLPLRPTAYLSPTWDLASNEQSCYFER